MFMLLLSSQNFFFVEKKTHQNFKRYQLNLVYKKDKVKMKVNKTFVLISIFLLPFFCYVKCLNNRPIIGIIAKETSSHDRSFQFGNSSITASYVQFLETGGARVVPIMIWKSPQYYIDIMRKLNGVLFPGGGDLVSSGGYGRTARIIFEIAHEMNDNGDFFPLWGTCLGFEVLNYLAAYQKNWMTLCSADDLPANLNFVNGFNNSRMYKNAGEKLLDAMIHDNVTINYHHWCITYQNYTLSGLDKYFRILSTNQDSRNVTFISSIEAYDYPFYGVAFHPEIVLFEWATIEGNKNSPHTSNATRVSQFFANFFVDEARKSSHQFPSKAEEDAVLIYNYQSTFTGKLNMDSEKTYYFP